MVKGPIPMKGGDEYDALTRWAKLLFWKPGERQRIKRGYQRRVRKWWKRLLRQDPNS